MSTTLKSFLVTIRVFDPRQGPEGGISYALPVDSPDMEHACASTLANAASFTEKVGDGQPLPLAFMVAEVRERS